MPLKDTIPKRYLQRLVVLGVTIVLGIVSGSVASAHILTPHTGNDNWHQTTQILGTCRPSLGHMDGDYGFYSRAFATTGYVSGTCNNVGSRIVGIYKGHDHPEPHHFYYASWSSGFDTFSSTPSLGWYYVEHSEHRANSLNTYFTL